MPKKLTYNEVKKFIEGLGYELLSKEYINSKTKLLIKCDKGHEFEMIYNMLQSGRRCPKCKGENLAKRQTKSYEEVEEFINSIGYKLLSKEYHKGTENLDIVCENGHHIHMSYKRLKRGDRCPECYNLRRGSFSRLSFEFVKEYINNLGYELLSESYKNNASLLDIKCDKGHKFRMSYNHFQSGQRCPTCSCKRRTDKNKIPFKEVKEYIENEGYDLLSDKYINSYEYLMLKCPNGHIFKSTYNNFRHSGSRCSICKQSNGENRIEHYLNLNNIEFEFQYRFNDCKFYKALPFDFYLPKYNCCIEYDGIQHFEIIEFFGGLDKFIDTKIRDTIKNEYCKKNNIKLIRISYLEVDNIEEVLNKEINKLI